MNMEDLIEFDSRVTCAKKEAIDAVNTLLEGVKLALKRGDKVTISKIGTFSTKLTKPRVIKNPRSKKIIHVGARKAVKFKS